MSAPPINDLEPLLSDQGAKGAKDRQPARMAIFDSLPLILAFGN
jgi:hypothetical protein